MQQHVRNEGFISALERCLGHLRVSRRQRLRFADPGCHGPRGCVAGEGKREGRLAASAAPRERQAQSAAAKRTADARSAAARRAALTKEPVERSAAARKAARTCVRSAH
jgi:hypothetical protein